MILNFLLFAAVYLPDKPVAKFCPLAGWPVMPIGRFAGFLFQAKEPG
jgi:hypothetical protein